MRHCQMLQCAIFVQYCCPPIAAPWVEAQRQPNTCSLPPQTELLETFRGVDLLDWGCGAARLSYLRIGIHTEKTMLALAEGMAGLEVFARVEHVLHDLVDVRLGISILAAARNYHAPTTFQRAAF